MAAELVPDIQIYHCSGTYFVSQDEPKFPLYYIYQHLLIVIKTFFMHQQTERFSRFFHLLNVEGDIL